MLFLVKGVAELFCIFSIYYEIMLSCSVNISLSEVVLV